MCADCGWEDLLEQIEELREDERYEFAAETLEGIDEWVNRNEHCTDGQRSVVENIRRGRE